MSGDEAMVVVGEPNGAIEGALVLQHRECANATWVRLTHQNQPIKLAGACERSWLQY